MSDETEQLARLIGRQSVLLIGTTLYTLRDPTIAEQAEFQTRSGFTWGSPEAYEYMGTREGLAETLMILFEVSRDDALACVDRETTRVAEQIKGLIP